MALKFFTIPVRDALAVEAEVNGFLRAHRVLAIDRRFVDQGDNSYWAICVDYLSGSETSSGREIAKKERIDYREVLPPEEFSIFVRLRDLRKQLAVTEGVPVYTIFTNDQLAEMVRRRVSSKADLEAIAGVGDARIGKYGQSFLDALRIAGRDHAPRRKPD